MLLGLVDDSACPVGPVSEELGFFEGIDYGIGGQAFSVTVVQDEPDFVAEIGCPIDNSLTSDTIVL